MERSVAKQSKAKHCLLRAGPTAGQQQGPPCRAAKMPCVVPFLLPSILRCCPQHPPTDITPAPSGGFAVDEWSDGASMTEHHEWSRHTEGAAYKLTHEAQHRHNCRTSSIFADHNVLDLGSAVGPELSTVTTVCRIVRL